MHEANPICQVGKGLDGPLSTLPQQKPNDGQKPNIVYLKRRPLGRCHLSCLRGIIQLSEGRVVSLPDDFDQPLWGRQRERPVSGPDH